MRIKVIKMADKSDFGWSTVNEYLSDELASNSDDEKRMYRAERRAERKTKERGRRFRPTDRKESASTASAVFSSHSGPSASASGQPNRRVFSSSQRLGPCFKISSFLFFTPQTCFVFCLRIYGVTLRPFPMNILQDLLTIFVYCFCYSLLVSAELKFLS